MTSRQYAEVIGDPIAQSLSPAIHGFWLEKLGIAADYGRRQVSRAELKAYLDSARADEHWRGCNVTMPLKLDALTLADEASDRALGTGAANLIVPRSGKLLAANTDVGGILAVLTPELMPPESEVCIIGTGGAARAALVAMRIRNASLALITARDLRAGIRLVQDFGFGGTVRDFEDPHNVKTADVIINATPLGMTGQPAMPQELLNHIAGSSSHVVVLDLITSPTETELIRVARALGRRTVTGLNVLVEQAAESFQLFFGKEAPRDKDGELMHKLGA